jgi:hypothetical protein
VAKYSYFDDFTEEEREMVRQKMKSEGQSWKEIMERFGHPSKWETNPLQPSLFELEVPRGK